MRTNEAAIDVQGLSLRYNGVTALDGIDLRVEKGSVVGLVGRNGAGKSSLLHCLVGLTIPQQGRVRVLDSPGEALSDGARARIGFVGQRPDLLEWLSVGEHLEYLGRFYPGWSRERADELCIRFGLPQGLRIRRLSPGEQQRLCLVLALAHDPELLILDEPVAALDPVARRDFMRALFERGEGRTALISSHLLGDLERIVSHVVFLDRGRVQLAGAWDELAEQVRVVSCSAPLAPASGLLQSRQDGSGWRGLVDLRHYDSAALPPDARVQALNLDDLFAELQS